MMSLRKSVVLAGAMLAVGSSVALADVVCNQEGDCWRVKERRTYAPELKLQIHPDTWKWEEKESTRYRWREPGQGHGYWRNGVWVTIRG